MGLRIADTFTASLARLPAQDQRAAKTTAFDIPVDPAAPGLRLAGRTADCLSNPPPKTPR
jgi:hypothetical protein